MAGKIKNFLDKWKGLSRKKKIISVIVIILCFIFAGGALGYNYWFNKPHTKVDIDPVTGDIIVTEDKSPRLDERVTILLVGVDERKNQKTNTFNTDSLILASIDPKTEQISLLSIPRDTRIQIPKHGWEKINAAASYGGLNTTVAVVQQLTGIKIDGYIKTNFDGFKGIIDTLGGITVNVEKDMYYETGDKEDGYINLKKGEQVLDGSKALQYARFRHDTFADITRTARQQVVLKAVAKKMMQAESIPKIPLLIPKFYQAVETNLPMSDLLTMAKVGAKFDSSKVISQTLPGSFLTLDGISYWGVDAEKAKKVAQDLLQGIAMGNTIDKLLQASVDAGKSGNKPTEEPQPEAKVGSVTLTSVGPDSITLAVSASTGVYKTELWRGNTMLKSWTGTAASIKDSNLSPDTEYSYVLKAFGAGNNLLLATNPLKVTTKGVVEIMPTVTLKSPASDFVTSQKSVLVEGNTEPGNSVLINGNPVAINADGSFKQEISLVITGDKITTISVVAKNKTGQSSQPIIRRITFAPADETPPPLEVSAPPTTTESSVEITGKTEPGCTVTINNHPVPVLADGSFKYTVSNLVIGENVIKVTAKDAAGNPTTESLTVVRK